MLPILPNLPSLASTPHNLIAGVDEAGRGPLAGPIRASSVIIPRDGLFSEEKWINDSKKLSAIKREQLYHKIKTHYITASYHITATQIDAIGIGEANKQACLLAAEAMPESPTIILIDGNLKFLQNNVISIIKGDTLSRCIAASSIIAKYERDQYMQQLEVQFPGYGFAQHKGYGTKAHIEAIHKLGITIEHRKSFLSRIIAK